MLVISIFYFSYNVFAIFTLLKSQYQYFSHIHFVVCKCFQFGLVENCVVKFKRVDLLCGFFFNIENSSNIRRDITAETSLMNDLDKRINYELESPQDGRFNSRNVNLLISLNSDENLVGNNGAWCFHDSSKTTSDNASIGRSGITDTCKYKYNVMAT